MCDNDVKRHKSIVHVTLALIVTCGFILQAPWGHCYFPNTFLIEIKLWRWSNVLLVYEHGTVGSVITSLKASMTPRRPPPAFRIGWHSARRKDMHEKEQQHRTTPQQSSNKELDLNGLKTCCRTFEVLSGFIWSLNTAMSLCCRSEHHLYFWFKTYGVILHV